MTHTNYTREQLLEAFNRVQNAEHWKNPINATFTSNADESFRDLVSSAISYFTGTCAIWTQTSGNWNVTADGYYAGPCN